MPQRHCSVKDARQNQARRLHNLDIKSDLRRTVKDFVALVKTDAKKASEMLGVVYKKVDKAAKRNLMSKNTASRRKSYFARLLASTKA